MINRDPEREGPQRLPGVYRSWLENTERLVDEFLVASRLSAAMDYSEPVYLLVDLDAGVIDFESRTNGSPVSGNLDSWLLTCKAELPVIVVGDRRRVVWAFELPSYSLLADLQRADVPTRFAGADRVSRAPRRPEPL